MYTTIHFLFTVVSCRDQAQGDDGKQYAYSRGLHLQNYLQKNL